MAGLERFGEAIQLYGQDARYFYFRGVAKRYSQQPEYVKSADADIEFAVALESEGRPGSFDVSRALERVQGEPRRWIENYRSKLKSAVGKKSK